MVTSVSTVRRPLLTNGEALRQTIDRGPGGGGPPFHPFTVAEAVDRLRQELPSLRSGIAAIPAEARGGNVVIEARLSPTYLSASSFPARLLSEAGLTPIGTRPAVADKRTRSGVEPDQPTKTVYLAVADPDLRRLGGILADPLRGTTKELRDDLLTIEALAAARPAVAVDADRRNAPRPALMEAVLHGAANRRGEVTRQSRAALDRFFAWIETAGGQAEDDWVRTSGSLTFLPVRLTAAQSERAAQFNGLRALHPMPKVRDLPDGQAVGEIFPQPSTAPPDGARPLRVAVFDGGVDGKSPYWAGRVKNTTVGTVDPDPVAQRHGALVTSAMLYGHLDGTVLSAPANMKISHYETVPQRHYDQDLRMYWLLDVIKEQVTAGDFDVVTICVAPHLLLTDDHVDRWTSTLDELAHDEQVLFVVAAGNNGQDPEHAAGNRVMVPADATNILAVGAADAPAPKASRAAYSAVGPGRPGSQIRPSGIAFGGTDTQPFIATDNDGGALRFTGTSCAAPLVTHSLADLADRIGETRLSPLALRVFPLHFARPCKRGQSLFQVGHGHLPTTYEFLQDGPANLAHIYYVGRIGRTEFIPLSLPVPDLAPVPLKIRYTLVTSTATNSADPVDYTSAGLEIAFRPHANRYRFGKGAKGKVLNTKTEKNKIAALISSGYVMAAEPATASIGTKAKHESMLRSEGKWESARTGSHKYVKADSLYRPRVELSHLARENGSLVGNAPDLSWALLVTLEAAAGTDLYSKVLQEYTVLTPLAVPSATLPATSA